jgi:hypothetical protein
MHSLYYFPLRWAWTTAALLALLAAGPTTQAQTLYNAAGSTMYQSGDLYNIGTVQNAGTYAPASGTLLVAGGDFVNTGTISTAAATGTVKLVESAASTGHSVSLGGQAVPNLDLDVPANTKLGSAGTVLGTLTLRNGHLLTSPTASDNYVLMLGPEAALVGETDAHYVKGRVTQARSVSGSSPINFGNMGFTINPVGGSFPLTVERRAGLNQVGTSYGVNPGMPALQGTDRTWALSSTATTLATPATLTMSWLAADDHGLTFSGVNAQVWRSDDGGMNWVKEGAVQNGASRSVSVQVTRLNALYTVSSSAAPLPVTLTNFAAQLLGTEAVALTWNTASESNTDRFEVERSIDGVSFTRIKSVMANGNSASALTYAYRDAMLPAGTSTLYYRLRIVDHDNSVVYSPVRTVALTKRTELTVSVAPNPVVANAAAQLWVTSPATGAGTLTILNAIGQLVGTQRMALVEGTQQVPLSLQALPAGVYTLRLQVSDRAATTKLVIQ